MKRALVLLVIVTVTFYSLLSQKVTNYTCQLDNGIKVKMEQCWNHVWVDQKFETIKTPGQTPPLSLNVRTLGDLTSKSSFKLMSAGKEVKLQSAKPGSYTLKLTFQLSGKPGTLSFDVENIEIKPNAKTNVSVTLYDYQIKIEETPGSLKGLAGYSSKIERYKGTEETNPSCGIISFFEKGKRTSPLTPDEATNNKAGKIKPGTYDVLITLGSSARTQKIWLENFTLKPDVTYGITTNLNAGIISYTGGNKDVRVFHIYPAGTADRQQGAPAPDKSLEIFRCESQDLTTACPPGTFDILLNFRNGAKYEWRKNIVVQTSTRAQVK